MAEPEPHWLERLQPIVSTAIALVVGLLALWPWANGAWERTSIAPFAAGGAYLVVTILLDFVIAVVLTRDERRRTLLRPTQPKPTPTKAAPAPLPFAIARVRAR